MENCHVEWNEIGDVWLYWDDVKSRIIRNVGERIGFSSGKETKKNYQEWSTILLEGKWPYLL